MRTTTRFFRHLIPCLLLLSASIPVLFAQVVQEAGFVDELYANVGGGPIGFAFAPDGRMFVWYKSGRIKIWDGGTQVSTFIDISARVNTAIDRGLIGFTLDPDFASNGYVYVAYVYEPTAGQNTNAGPRTERVSRFQADPADRTHALPGETVLLGKITTLPCALGADCIPNDAAIHTIDHLAFGRDGELYVSIGDGGYNSTNSVAPLAQNLNSYRGKLLRVDADGTAPGDNPFYDGTDSVRSKVFSYGHRNPYRFSFDQNGTPIVGDVGWFTYEELDRGRGKNFGWPCYEGNTRISQYANLAVCQSLTPAAAANPTYFYDHTVGSTVIAGPVYGGTTFPAQFRGNLFFADYSGHWIRRAILDSPGGSVTSVKLFASGQQGPVYLDVGPDGNLYYVAILTGQVRRIRYTSAADQPPVAQISATPNSGNSPLDVNFSSAGSSDPQGSTLTFTWDFGDGSTSSLENPLHRYTSSMLQSFAAKLTVQNAAGLTDSATATIMVGDQPPVPAIKAPADGTVVQVGQTVNFSGGATDPEDGVLPASALSWQVILHHNDHTHFIASVTGDSGSFVVQPDDPVGVFSYDIILTATDTSGVQATTKINLPVQSGCTLSTVVNTMTVCNPAEGATVASPVIVTGGATSNKPITGVRIYLDSSLAFAGTSATFTAPITAPPGAHRLSIQAWNTAGTLMKAVRNITVSSGTPPPPPPPHHLRPLVRPVRSITP